MDGPRPLAHYYTDTAAAERQKRLSDLRTVFYIKKPRRGGYSLRLPNIRLASLGIRQVVYAQVLYPAVMDVDCRVLDVETYTFLRGLLGIPPNTSPELLWIECHVWPAHIYRDLRTLNYTRN